MVLFCLVPVLYLGSAISPILYVRLLRNRSIGVAVALLVALVGVSVLVAGWTVTAFGGAFGPGAWLQCLTPLMIAIPAVLLVVNASRRSLILMVTEFARSCTWPAGC